MASIVCLMPVPLWEINWAIFFSWLSSSRTIHQAKKKNEKRGPTATITATATARRIIKFYLPFCVESFRPAGRPGIDPPNDRAAEQNHPLEQQRGPLLLRFFICPGREGAGPEYFFTVVKFIYKVSFFLGAAPGFAFNAFFLWMGNGLLNWFNFRSLEYDH